MAEADPLKAEELASGWKAADGGLPASHCLALALAGQTRYSEAARALSEIAEQMRLGGYFFFSEERADRELLGEIFGQAGNAWILAEKPVKAYESLTEAVGIVPAWSNTIIEHWIDRARALAMLANYDLALKDLAAAQERDPNRIETYVFRASALRHLKKLDLAAAELEGAFRLSEEHQEALLERGILRQQSGDTDGALRDWIKLLRRHPDSTAAQVARANLEAMNIDIDEWEGVDEVDVTGKKRQPR
jgi:tetratricopeptide (TPR) repeat protein